VVLPGAHVDLNQTEYEILTDTRTKLKAPNELLQYAIVDSNLIFA